MQAAAKIAQKIVKSVSKMGDVLSGSMKVGSPPVKISLPQMAMDVRKSTIDSLLHKKIESDIGSCMIDALLDSDDDSCVSSQVLLVSVLSII